MVRNAYISSLAALAALLLTACDATIHEYPHQDLDPQRFELRLSFDTELPLYRSIVYSKAGDDALAPEALDVRHKIAIFRADAQGAFGELPDTTVVVAFPASEGLNRTVPLALAPGGYRFMVWSDYVAPGTTADRLYTTESLYGITISSGPESYRGCDDSRDAFRGITTATVVNPASADGKVALASGPVNVADVDMRRPLAKFVFIATDVDEFLEKQGPDALQTVRVAVRYDYFMPCSYDLHSLVPNDSWWGISFPGRVAAPDDAGEAQLGFDYVFVGEGETSVQASVAVYREADGVLLSNSLVIDVPLLRSRLTEVRGRFFTEGPSGGVAVVPDFNGEYNIEIR